MAYNPAAFAHQLEGLSRLKKSGDYQGTLSGTHGSTSSSLQASLSQPSLSPPLRSLNQFQQTNLAATNPNSPLRLSTLSHTVDDSIVLKGNRSGFSHSTNSTIPDLKKIWQVVLRECHRADPERTGQVNRMTFIAALEHGDHNKVDKYILWFAAFVTNYVLFVCSPCHQKL